MKRKDVTSLSFLGVTGAAIAWEIIAAFDGNTNTSPWTDLIAEHVPPVVTYAAIAALLAWLPRHFVNAYAKRGTNVDTTTIPATPEHGSAENPLVSVGTVTAAVVGALSCAVAFGMKLTPEQTGAIIGIAGILAPVVVALVGRRKVFAPATVRALVVQAAASGVVNTEPAVVPAENRPLL